MWESSQALTRDSNSTFQQCEANNLKQWFTTNQSNHRHANASSVEVLSFCLAAISSGDQTSSASSVLRSSMLDQTETLLYSDGSHILYDFLASNLCGLPRRPPSLNLCLPNDGFSSAGSQCDLYDSGQDSLLSTLTTIVIRVDLRELSSGCSSTRVFLPECPTSVTFSALQYSHATPIVFVSWSSSRYRSNYHLRLVNPTTWAYCTCTVRFPSQPYVHHYDTFVIQVVFLNWNRNFKYYFHGSTYREADADGGSEWSWLKLLRVELNEKRRLTNSTVSD